ncbi:hypothetical protein PGT21_008386 [Puccinia graminis f. sp. tritici]|uniref:Uncharacterized protein n=1 Tax=Puccinia graminis f. sp. tritici TaxID=56615 RepID=A0A5B0QHU2_PUCGR|nr:hypothetical protein PGT21_008386 [Puccinia graminis f. sp. tritici]
MLMITGPDEDLNLGFQLRLVRLARYFNLRWTPSPLNLDRAATPLIHLSVSNLPRHLALVPSLASITPHHSVPITTQPTRHTVNPSDRQRLSTSSDYDPSHKWICHRYRHFQFIRCH